MPSHSNNPSNERGPRRRMWRTALVLALFAGYLVAKPHLDETFGVRSPTVTDNPIPTSQAMDEGRSEWEVVVRPDSGFPAEIRPSVFESPAGLIFGPGGAEGHRIDHIMRHAADDPDRPVHGVFDGDREEILALLDEAYEIALGRGPPVDVEQDGERTVYTIDMGRRVGYVGGAAGLRGGHPDATHLRLVLEGREVITAFPLRP